jgi:hypothetical protein
MYLGRAVPCHGASLGSASTSLRWQRPCTTR